MKTTSQPNDRKPDFPIEEMFYKRWSPRAMDGEKITEEMLMPLFEAARWAPSAYNSQPWKFFYVLRNGPYWEKYIDLMVDFNKEWTKNAGALIIIASKKTLNDGNISQTHSFDSGAAWMNLALQADALGYVCHGMSGFDYEAARKLLKIPEDYSVEAMIALGMPGDVESLPEQIRNNEKPNGRKPISDFIYEGIFKE